MEAMHCIDKAGFLLIRKVSQLGFFCNSSGGFKMNFLYIGDYVLYEMSTVRVIPVSKHQVILSKQSIYTCSDNDA